MWQPAYFLSLLLVISPPTLAADLSIDQAVKEALEQNFDLLAQRYNVPVAEARIIQARLRPNPVLTAGADYQDLLGTGFSSVNQAGPAEANLRADFLMEGGGKRARRVDMAEAARSVAQLQLMDATRRLVLDVQSAFVDVLRARDDLNLARENLKVFTSIVDVNSARVKAGDLAKVELVRSRVAALQSQSAIRLAELRYRFAKSRLQYLLGRDRAADSVEVTGSLRDGQAPAALEDLERNALKLRPDLEALRRDSARAAADLRLQTAQGKVDYTFSVQYHRQYDNAIGNSLGFFLSAPLPMLNRNQGEISRARLEQRQAEARIRAAENSVRTEVGNAYEQCLAMRDTLDSIEKEMLTEAREVSEATEYSYRRGEASFLEFLDAQRAFNETMQSYNEARAEYARSLYVVDSATGQSVNP
jgi:outer membrane protein, heavy metal efflux system